MNMTDCLEVEWMDKLIEWSRKQFLGVMFKLRLREQEGATTKNHPGKKAVSRRILKQNIPELGKGWVQSEDQREPALWRHWGEDHRGRSQGTFVWSMGHGFCPFLKMIA